MITWQGFIEFVQHLSPQDTAVWSIGAILFLVVLFLKQRARQKAKAAWARADIQATDFLNKLQAAKNCFIDHRMACAWQEDADDLFSSFHLPRVPGKYAALRHVLQLLPLLQKNIDAWNQDYIRRESKRLDAFFGRLDSRQREACIADEIATLVVAGAGSGKTSTIQKKVEYLITEKEVDPRDILLLSFTNKAADEMTERLQSALPGMPLRASTFHKFGLGIVKSRRETAYDISEPQFCRKTILHALSPESLTDEQCRGLLRYFAYCLNSEPENLDEVKSKGDYINLTRTASLQTFRGMATSHAHDKTTFQGETVKSFEELEIANWLFLNGIAYDYEKPYDKPLPEDPQHHRTYKPDFYLPDYDIWIEHFGINEQGEPPPFFSKAEQIAYKEGIEWKRKLHLQNNTTLVETYSWWHRQGKLTERLWEELSLRGVKLHHVDPKPLWKKLLDAREDMFLREFAQLASSFIALAKSHHLAPNDLMSLLEKSNATGYQRYRLMSFLQQAQWLFRYYEDALQEKQALDFHDMINEATEIVNERQADIHPYRYVIIDEFQDISAGRAELIQSVVRTTGAKLFCVGDDWQSIYRFAGSDISIFTHFEDHFGFSRTIHLENTYRNSAELLDIAGTFIMKNRQQLRKALKSAMHCEHPIVCLSYGDKKALSEALLDALQDIVRTTCGKKASVLLLGRHNQESQWPCATPDLSVNKTGDVFTWGKHPELNISFMTVHKAKGLEADYTILLNFKNDLLGFPNRIADDPILSLLLANPEGMPFAEERRVFYVALTRTKNRTYILTPRTNASVFLDDLPEETKTLLNDEQGAVLSCPVCKSGHLIKRVRRTGQGHFYGCSNFPRCDYTLPEQAQELTPETARCSCGGYLVPKRNPKTGHMFLGCTEYTRLRSYPHDFRPLKPKK